MARVSLNQDLLTSIADAIREKTGTSSTYKPSQMASAIMTISGGGITPTGTISITENGTYNVTQYASADVDVSSEVKDQDKTVSPTESVQSITYDSGYTGLGTVTVNAISSTYVGSGITRRSSSNLTVSGDTITAPAGYYESAASTSVATGTAGTPTAAKGTVSNHSINITPSVTNTTGYITGGTKTGTAVSVSASELVSGNKSISSNGTNIDVTNYETVSVSVSANNQNKTVSPTESEQSITCDSGYTGLGTVTVGAISSTYIGSGITQRSSTDLTVSGATITAPAGYYSASASKSVSSGSATGPSSLSGSSASISTGTNTITLTKTNVATTPTVSAGYIASATNSSATITLSASVTTKAAATITPGTSNQTISSGTYITGTQTIVGDADLVATNIKTGVQIFNVTGSYTSDATAAAGDIVDGQTAYVNGSKITGSLVVQDYYTNSSAPSSSLGNNGDLYLQTAS